jgi:hypothetical protein
MTQSYDFYTVGEIADRLQEPLSRIAYVVSKHRIKPVRRTGIIRLFSTDQIKAIQEGLYLLRPSHRRTI